jgi:hypothetical protein
MSVRVAEGEIIIKTQSASRNTNSLTRDLDGLSKQSRETGRRLTEGQKEIQRFGLGMVSATSNAAALSASLRFAGKTGAVALGFAVLARGTIAFVQQMQDLRLESEKTSKSLGDTFKAGMLSKSSDEAKASAKSIGDQIFDLEQKTKRLDVWKEIRKFIEQASAKLGVAVDLQTNLDEKAIEQAKSLKASLETEQKRLKTMELLVLSGNSMSKAMEETFSIEEASTELSREKSKYIQIGNSILLKDSIGLAQKEYETQSNILSLRERELSELEKIATQNKDLATLESVRTDRNKARIVALGAEASLIKIIRSEQGNILKGSAAGRQALAGAEKRKRRQDIRAAYNTEEAAVQIRQNEENTKRKTQGLPALGKNNIRDIMAEEAVGLRIPSAAMPQLGIATGINQAPSAPTAAGLKGQVFPVPIGTSAAPEKQNDSINKLTTSVQSLVDTMKTGVYVK